MSSKISEPFNAKDGSSHYLFDCPGCGHSHSFVVGPGVGPRWSWNGSREKPTFGPSLLCDGHDPSRRCHCFVTDGQIQFLSDCWHALAGKTVELPDWDEEGEPK